MAGNETWKDRIKEENEQKKTGIMKERKKERNIWSKLKKERQKERNMRRKFERKKEGNE